MNQREKVAYVRRELAAFDLQHKPNTTVTGWIMLKLAVKKAEAERLIALARAQRVQSSAGKDEVLQGIDK